MVDNLTLMVEYSDIPEASPAGSTLLMIKRKALDTDDGGWQFKKSRLIQNKPSKTDTDSSNQEKASTTTSPETDEEIEKMKSSGEYPQSPTFWSIIVSFRSSEASTGFQKHVPLIQSPWPIIWDVLLLVWLLSVVSLLTIGAFCSRATALLLVPQT